MNYKVVAIVAVVAAVWYAYKYNQATGSWM